MVDRNSPEPLYIQLDRIFRENIRNGTWIHGSIIPSENELCKIYGISRMTVRSVINGLVRENLLYRVQGKGTFVQNEKVATLSPAYLGIRDQLEAQGFRITTQLLSFEKKPADFAVAQALNCPEGEPVFAITRLRFMNDTPISIHESYLPVALCQDLQEEDFYRDKQLCHILDERFSLKPAKVEETLESVLATREQMDLLQVAPKSPLLLLEDQNLTAEGVVFEFSRIFFRGDKMKLHFEYK